MRCGERDYTPVHSQQPDIMVNIKVVIGANYGDEGKGLMTDYFTARLAPSGRVLGVLSNGGSQRGHTVVTPDGKTHVFRHFSAGTLAGADTYIPASFIVNPMNFCQELQTLSDLIGYTPNVYIEKNARITTPFEMIVNQILENARGDQRHGSCGVGIWETLVLGGARWGEILRMSEQQRIQYLRYVRDNYLYDRLQSKGVTIPPRWMEVIKSEGLIQRYVQDLNHMVLHSTTVSLPQMAVWDYPNIVFENGQGLRIGEEFGDYHFSTPSNTGLKNPADMISKWYSTKDIVKGMTDIPTQVEVCYVTRTYYTRHGAGSLTDELSRELLNAEYHSRVTWDLTNTHNDFQGSLRYAPALVREIENITALDFANNAHPGWKKSIAVTHVDEMPDSPVLSMDNVKYFASGRTRDHVL